MRLYLSSYGLGNKPNKLVDLMRGKKKIAVIANASDYYDAVTRSERVSAQFEELQAIGLEPEELDLRNYFQNMGSMATKLAEYDGVLVRGGNAFVLRRAMKNSGFDGAILPLLKNDMIVYAGYSAGSAAATPTMEGIDIVDDKDIVPEGYDTEIVWGGLNLVPYSIAPHYKSDHPESEAIDKVVSYFEKKGIQYRALKDGEVIVINGDDSEIVG